MSAKDDFKTEVSKIKRLGADVLLGWLEGKTDFFTAPASTRFHGAHESGLIIHSLYVCDIMKELNEALDLGIDEESIIICALFHDVCKANFYVEDNTPATSAQLNYLLDLCQEAKINPPPKTDRTKAYVQVAISDLKEGKPLPEFKKAYSVKDQLPMGHGEKSIYLIQKCMSLTDVEALAIRWHLGGGDPGIHFGFPDGYPHAQAVRENKLVALLMSADLAATYLLEKW